MPVTASQNVKLLVNNGSEAFLLYEWRPVNTCFSDQFVHVCTVCMQVFPSKSLFVCRMLFWFLDVVSEPAHN